MTRFEAVIGLEVHVRLGTRSKLFCGCPAAFSDQPNHNTCPVCLGLPGVLPALNRKAVEYAVTVGLALNCAAATSSRFARKNYYYPDLPKAYQISQYEQPICRDGCIEIEDDGVLKRIGITRVHLEEDAGRLVHEGDDMRDAQHSLIDYNRVGTPLIEIVSEPDLRTPEEAYAYLMLLRSTIRYLGVSECNMEEGSLRCDANVSLRPVGQAALGVKVEVKNMNSFKNVREALRFEIGRQEDALLDGEEIVQETRLWDVDKNRTYAMRGKEEAHDYRYFPEPDLLPMTVTENDIEKYKKNLPELPLARRQRLERECELSAGDAGKITAERELADYFEEAVAAAAVPKNVVNILTGDIAAHLNETGKRVADLPLGPSRLAALLHMQETGRISGKMIKTLLPELLSEDIDPERLVEERGLAQISDSDELETLARDVIAANPGPAADVRSGKMKAIGFLVGQLMKATRGQANPKIANETLRRLLQEKTP